MKTFRTSCTHVCIHIVKCNVWVFLHRSSHPLSSGTSSTSNLWGSAVFNKLLKTNRPCIVDCMWKVDVVLRGYMQHLEILMRNSLFFNSNDKQCTNGEKKLKNVGVTVLVFVFFWPLKIRRFQGLTFCFRTLQKNWFLRLNCHYFVWCSDVYLNQSK